MLSLFAISYNTMRLGLEAQNATAFRLFRLAGAPAKWRRTFPNRLRPLRMTLHGNNDRAETAPRREEDSQKIRASSEAQQRG